MFHRFLCPGWFAHYCASTSCLQRKCHHVGLRVAPRNLEEGDLRSQGPGFLAPGQAEQTKTGSLLLSTPPLISFFPALTLPSASLSSSPASHSQPGGRASRQRGEEAGPPECLSVGRGGGGAGGPVTLPPLPSHSSLPHQPLISPRR